MRREKGKVREDQRVRGREQREREATGNAIERVGPIKLSLGLMWTLISDGPEASCVDSGGSEPAVIKRRERG